MRKLTLLALAAAWSLPAAAAHRETVAQLEQALASALAEHRSDADVARQLGEVELSERLTAARLDRLAARLPLQPRTAVALELLSDQSAFLDPPAAELPATEPPDATEQQRMLDAARAYSVQTWTRLPNFFVTRTTTRFDDSAQVIRKGEWPVRLGLHPVGSASREITFREGKEVTETAAESGGSAKPTAADELGLRSWGEFGPALTVVLTDMGSRMPAFSHWERTAGGLAAVFHYEVPRDASHYAVAYSYFDQTVIGRTQFGYSGNRRSPQQMASIPRTRELQTYSEKPGYHGEIDIDPATGAVLRLTIQADLGSGDPLLKAETMVEYAPVTIGDRAFICPTRSVSLSVKPASPGACDGPQPSAANGVSDAGCANSNVVLINETAFAGYHRLGSTARLIADGSVPGSVAPPATGALGTPAATSPAPAQAAAPAVEAPAQTAEAAPPPAPPAPPSAPAQTVIPEISMSAASGVPDVPANAPQPQDTGFSLKVTTRLVDVGVIAIDKKGRPVTDLKPEDFEIYDNGRKQEVRSFAAAPAAAAQPAAPSSASASEEPLRSFSNRALDTGPAAAPSAAAPSGGTVLLLDESHIAWNDLNYARSQMLKFLGSVPAGVRVGLYTMTGIGFRVLVEVTADHNAVAARLKAFLPTAQSVNEAQEEERRNRQQFDVVHNVADLNSVNGNHTDVPDAEQPVDPELMTMGSNPARASLIILAHVARHLASIPGHKSLVWVSSDNVLAEWEDQAVGIDKGSKGIESYAVRAQEAMNDAHASVYPFDVSQLETGGVTADMQHSNVELAPAAADNLATAAGAGAKGASPPNMRDTGTGRITAQMSQDVHPIQGPVREVAAATGGRTIRRSGDLAAALAGIVEDGNATYQLSFSPQGLADDQYHAITVKLPSRKGVVLRYRTGYLFAREPATLKDRFRQAVWQPTDSSEIGVHAEVAPSGGGWSVKVNIAAADLGMAQQGGRWMDKLDIFLIQRDDAGIHAQVEGQTLGLRLKPATYQNVLGSGVPFERAVEMKPGMGSLRVLVVDENSGRMGSVTVPAGAMEKAVKQ